MREHEIRSNREFCLFVISSYSKLYTLKVYWALFNGIGHFITHIQYIYNIYNIYIYQLYYYIYTRLSNYTNSKRHLLKKQIECVLAWLWWNATDLGLIDMFLTNLDAEIVACKLRRYNEETKFPVTPSFVLAHSSDSI